MTPPTKPAGSASATAKVDVAPPKVDAKAPTDPNATDPKQWVPKASIGLALGYNLPNDAYFFGPRYGKLTDFTDTHIDVALMRDLTGGNLRFRVGGQLGLDHWTGNENTYGSTFNALTLGPRVELDWRRAFNFGDVAIFSRLGIGGGLGYGYGTGQAETISLHRNIGLGMALWADANIVNANVGPLEVGLDALFTTPMIDGDRFNSVGRFLGGQFTFRPSMKKMTVVVEKDKPVCEDDKKAIGEYITEIADLRAKNTKVKADLDELKGFLESGKDPLTTAKIRDALFYREVRKNLLKVDALKDKEEVIRKSLRTAFGKEENVADDILLKGIPSLTAEILKAAKDEAAKKYPVGYDFWAQVTGDPVPTELPPNVLDLPCDELAKWTDKLHQEEKLLIRRNADLLGRFDTAVLVDALKDHLGNDIVKFIEKAHGFVLDIVQPNFSLARPNEKDITRLREYVAKHKGQVVDSNDKELMTIMKPVFQLTDFELGNMKKIADQMNGVSAPSAVDDKKPAPAAADKAAPAADKAAPAGDKAAANDTSWMKNITFTIEGHTDLQGNEKDNQALSERRAETVKLLLVLFGVDEGRIEFIGYGKTRPAVPEKGSYAQIQTAQTKNRRVVIRVKGEVVSAPTTTDLSTVKVDPTKPAPDVVPGSADDKKPGKIAKPAKPAGSAAPAASGPPPVPKGKPPKGDSGIDGLP